jgi:iron complex transport system ATP-binding protein
VSTGTPPTGDGEGEAPVLSFRGVRVVRDGRPLLDDIDWVVRSGERWVILGPNGSGKTTLLRVAGARLWPTGGTVEILGRRLGSVDVRTLRSRVAFVSGAVARELRDGQLARDVVASGKFGALETWWHSYSDDDWAEADRLLASTGVGGDDGVGHREFGVISEGERQHVLLARALMSRPEVLLLDEPAAGLDMGARERLLAALGSIAGGSDPAPLVLVTHHTEEIPAGITHAVLLAQGRIQRSGPVADVLTSSAVSQCFSVAVTVGRDGERWWSRAPAGGAP